ncbi:MAG TPA: trypsin-like peptidase domain-containing protein [Myxococcales bacterium]|nr:trypsin-like peptidase domain-containing protein [Myxococcales bacterium]
MHRLAAALCLAFALDASADSADPADVERWVRARAAEHRAYLDQLSARLTAEGTPLWRERLPGEPALPDFTPPTSLAPLIRAVREGVVNIRAEGTADGSMEPRRSVGSGFIISPDGYLVTNNHVIERAQTVRATLADGRELSADVVGHDPATDVALLKIRGPAKELPFTRLGDSDRMQVGDWVVAIGNPFGLDHSVAHGMISAKERVIGVGAFDDFIQTDALINPGNSGGPLFNMRGEVVGVNTAIVSQGQGIGFAVPINMVKDLLPNLQENGRLARGWLGIVVQEEGAAPGERGALVQTVFRASPAARAGLVPGDRVTAVNGRPVEGYLQFMRRVAILMPGTSVRLTVLRAGGGKAQELAVTLGVRPAPDALEATSGPGFAEAYGLSVRDLTPEVVASLGLQEGTAGAVVSAVVPGSPSEKAGLREGDLVVEVNRRPVRDVKSFRAAVDRTPAGAALLVRYQRGGQTQVVAVEPVR